MNVFPTAEYCVCQRHLLQNMKLIYKDSLIDSIFFRCAKAYTIDKFEFYMKWMESIYPTIREYLSKVGFEKWARAYSRRRRYNMLTTNISECLNNILKEPREFLLHRYLIPLEKYFKIGFMKKVKQHYPRRLF